jgi:uncharacterized FlaG/YvyC family protein
MAKKKKAARQSSTRTASPKKVSLTREKVTPARKKVTPARKKMTPARQTKKSQSTRTARVSNPTGKSLEALNERLDMMLPEVMFRIAALEHLLVKNQLCSYEELVNARQFIQDQERT